MVVTIVLRRYVERARIASFLAGGLSCEEARSASLLACGVCQHLSSALLHRLVESDIWVPVLLGGLEGVPLDVSLHRILNTQCGSGSGSSTPPHCAEDDIESPDAAGLEFTASHSLPLSQDMYPLFYANSYFVTNHADGDISRLLDQPIEASLVPYRGSLDVHHYVVGPGSNAMDTGSIRKRFQTTPREFPAAICFLKRLIAQREPFVLAMHSIDRRSKEPQLCVMGIKPIYHLCVGHNHNGSGDHKCRHSSSASNAHCAGDKHSDYGEDAFIRLQVCLAATASREDVLERITTIWVLLQLLPEGARTPSPQDGASGCAACDVMTTPMDIAKARQKAVRAIVMAPKR